MTQTGSILLSWPQEASTLAYAIRYRRIRPNYTNWTDTRVQAPSLRLDNQESGTYEFQISSVGLFGATSSPTSFTYTLNVEAAQDTSAYAGLGEITLTPLTPDLGLLEWLDPGVTTATVELRHQSGNADPEWGNAATVLPPIPPEHGHAYVPLLDGAYLARLSGGVLTTSVNATRPLSLKRLLLTEIEEAPSFSGAANGVVVNPATGTLILGTSALINDLGQGEDIDTYGAIDGLGLVDAYTAWDSTGLFDSILLIDDLAPAWDGLSSIDGAGGVAPSGEYVFATTYDSGAVFDIHIRRRLQLATYLVSTFFNDRTALIDTWTDIDNLAPGDGDATVYVQTSTDSASWTDWQPLVNALIRGRYFRFKAQLRSTDPSQNVSILSLGATLDLDQVVQEKDGLTTNTITFDNSFYQNPTILISPFNSVSGDYYELSNVSRSGFDLQWRDSGGAAVTRQYAYQAVGYGKEIS
jgi:hypothetical protein